MRAGCSRAQVQSGTGSQTSEFESLAGDHGRAAPLVWRSVWRKELADWRNDFEDACLIRPRDLVPQNCRVMVLADRGFGDHKLFGFLDAWVWAL